MQAGSRSVAATLISACTDAGRSVRPRFPHGRWELCELWHRSPQPRRTTGPRQPPTGRPRGGEAGLVPEGAVARTARWLLYATLTDHLPRSLASAASNVVDPASNARWMRLAALSSRLSGPLLHAAQTSVTTGSPSHGGLVRLGTKHS